MSDSPPDYFDRVPPQDAVTTSTPVSQVVEGNPFQKARSEHLNEGAVQIESDRAIAEAQGKLILAKRFPRDEGMAYNRIIEACSRPGLAGVAFYSFGRGSAAVSGPSIRLAEEIQRCWGNMESGLRELSRKPGISEMEAFAWDYESNNLSTQRFTVRHIRDLKSGHADLTSERDIYEITANMGQRRVRARILAVIPSDLVEAAVAQCKRTIAGGSKLPIADRIKGAITRFRDVNVTAEMLIGYLGHPLDETTPDEIADLTGVYNSIKEGLSKPADHFGSSAAINVSAGKSKLDTFEEAHTKKTEESEGSKKDATSLDDADGVSNQTIERMGPSPAPGESAGTNESPYTPIATKTYATVSEWQRDMMVVIGGLSSFADVDALKADAVFVAHADKIAGKTPKIADEINDAIEDRISWLMQKHNGKT